MSAPKPEVRPGRFADLFLPLATDRRAALKASIAWEGVLVPIELDEKGQVLDGHTRLAICAELGITDYPTIVRPGLTEGQKLEHVLTLNLARRQLSKEQRGALCGELRGRGLSLRRIAELVGMSLGTVAADLSGVQNHTPGEVLGRDGKLYRPSRPAVIAKNRLERDRALKALASFGGDLPHRVLDARGLEKLARRDGYSANGAAEADATIGTATLLLGDMRERGAEIADASVDLLFTDPPYLKQAEHLWPALSEFAARVLKSDGMLIAYSGNICLPAAFDGLRQQLRFWCSGSIFLPGAEGRLFTMCIWTRSKPLLFFVRHDFTGPRAWFENVYVSEHVQKDAHPWQQSIGCARYYIGRLTSPGDLVCDPFLGGGTTGVAAVELGRDFVGIEIDPVAMATAEARIREAEQARQVAVQEGAP